MNFSAFSGSSYLEKTRKFRHFVSQGKIMNKICQILLNLKEDYRDIQASYPFKVIGYTHLQIIPLAGTL